MITRNILTELSVSEEKRIYGGELSKQFLTFSTETEKHRREIMRKSLNTHLKLGKENDE